MIELNKHKKFRRHHVFCFKFFFSPWPKKEKHVLLTKTLEKNLVTPHLFVPNKSLPPKQSCNQQKLGQIFAFRLDAVLVAGGLFDVILSMAGGGNDGVTLRFVSAMRLGLSRVVFRAQLFSTGKHGKIQRFGFCVFVWG